MYSRRTILSAAGAAGTLSVLSGCAGVRLPSDEALVRVKEGWLQGAESNGVLVFRNVPYGEDPYAPERRFLAPVPAKSWKGVRDARTPGAIPLQPSRENPEMIGGGNALVANIWAPKHAHGAPVMVWIPGGGSTNCDNNDSRFDGTAFAKDGVVLVTLNYRVNVDGFLKLKGADSNNGLRDMILGLQWVHDNISAFGGDPSRVTVFGQSAGGTHLTSLLASPKTKGLFAQAIVQSPSAVAQWESAADADHAAEIFSEKMGAAPTREAFMKLSNERLYGMKKIVSGLAQDPEWGRFSKGNTSVFKPFVDGDILLERPVDAIRHGAASGVRVVAGSTREEWRHYVVPSGAIDKLGEPEIRRLIENSGQAADLGAQYAAAGHGRTPGEVFTCMQGDLIFRMPCNRLLESLTTAGNAVWAYSFDWRSQVKGKSGAVRGAAHSNDVPFVFHTLESPGSVKTNGEDAPKALADEMHGAWVRFAKTGHPGWSAFNASTRMTRIFDKEVRTHSDPWAFERQAMILR